MDSYQEQVKRLRDSFKILEDPNLQLAEDLFHLARKHNDYEEMKTAVQIVVKQCIKRWGNAPEGLVRDQIYETAFQKALEKVGVPKAIAHALSPVMRMWAFEELLYPLSLHDHLFQKIGRNFLIELNLCLNVKVLHADPHQGFLTPGPAFPGKLVELSESFVEEMKTQ